MSKSPPRAENRAPANVDAVTPPVATAARVPLLLRPWHWLRRTLKRPVRLEVQGGNVHVRLDPPRTTKADPAAAAERDLRRAQAELAELLDRHSATRSVMPHLGILEKSLRRSGWRAIGKMPQPALQAAFDQLQKLVHNEASAGLAELRARMAAAVVSHAAAARRLGADSDLTLPTAHRPEVSEASHSLFDEMERSWTGDLSAAQLAAARDEAGKKA